MPAGLQTWDSAGNIIIDTSTLVLRDFTSIIVTNTNTSVNTIPMVKPIDTNISIVPIILSGPDNTPPQTRYNENTNEIEYQWQTSAGNRSANLNILLY